MERRFNQIWNVTKGRVDKNNTEQVIASRNALLKGHPQQRQSHLPQNLKQGPEPSPRGLVLAPDEHPEQTPATWEIPGNLPPLSMADQLLNHQILETAI